MKARGDTREILKDVNEIQNLVGSAMNLIHDDKGKESKQKASKQLEDAFELCLKIRNMYDPC